MWEFYFIISSKILLFILLFPPGYLLLLVIGAIRKAPKPEVFHHTLTTRFKIIIPAHNEAGVIGATVGRLKAIDYPADHFSIL